MTNKFQIPNRDFGIWALEFYRSTWPHYTHKLIGSGFVVSSSRTVANLNPPGLLLQARMWIRS
ncbi:hypothetical protein KsCSTR_10530 [Candidatus Kuenenia stuttgartiensis]|uniref:Uncharacterized protein n=1 Tax=Kuenenia stuttgartiensis TaxID=174633 RepID=A0A6G7GM44_KUEST|nr:hypothetical protein KsCSTR_10530 [Candidatus Kuenenia stuttgartiensis]